MGIEISFTKDALEWLSKRDGADIVIDLVYRKGRCTSAFCTMVPNIEVYVGDRKGTYSLEPVRSREGRVVHVARPILDAAERGEVRAVIERSRLRGLRLRGVDPYELGL
jgi:hypothetical protein